MALTPKAKGSGIGRDVLLHGPFLMSPGGNFHEAQFNSIDNAEDVSQEQEEMVFAFPTSASISNEPTPPLKSTIPVPLSSKLISTKRLFGGAISISLPDTFEDVSSLRQVPDHQEVFVDQTSEMSFIVEILAYEDVPDEASASHFFYDLAQCNEVSESVSFILLVFSFDLNNISCSWLVLFATLFLFLFLFLWNVLKSQQKSSLKAAKC